MAKLEVREGQYIAQGQPWHQGAARAGLPSRPRVTPTCRSDARLNTLARLLGGLGIQGVLST
jgi:hypothetical protein